MASGEDLNTALRFIQRLDSHQTQEFVKEACYDTAHIGAVEVAESTADGAAVRAGAPRISMVPSQSSISRRSPGWHMQGDVTL
mmetsp:Transcript_105616/g.294077  ORF Transcript_105616/g.294077 Transcript_105616/m.294077 type:complete len:83 (-) Transcript_105616:104-352(-)